MSLVRGEKYEVEIYDGGVWKNFVCARDANMNVETEMIETSVTGSGDYKTYEPTVHSAGIGFSGITALTVPGFITFPELQAWQFAKTKLLFRYVLTAIDLTTYVRQFYAFITNSTDTGSFDGIATFQLSAKVTGAITQTFTPPSPTTGTVFRYPAMGATAPPTVGSDTVTIPSLIGKNILHVSKDGRGSNNIILSGSPIAQQVLYDSTTGTFTWAFPFEDGENYYILYQNL